MSLFLPSVSFHIHNTEGKMNLVTTAIFVQQRIKVDDTLSFDTGDRGSIDLGCTFPSDLPPKLTGRCTTPTGVQNMYISQDVPLVVTKEDPNIGQYAFEEGRYIFNKRNKGSEVVVNFARG